MINVFTRLQIVIFGLDRFRVAALSGLFLVVAFVLLLCTSQGATETFDMPTQCVFVLLSAPDTDFQGFAAFIIGFPNDRLLGCTFGAVIQPPRYTFIDFSAAVTLKLNHAVPPDQYN